MPRTSASRQSRSAPGISATAIQAVIDAASGGGLDEVQKFLDEQSGDINSVKDANDRHLLHCLLARPSIPAQTSVVTELCQHILERGAHVNASTKLGLTPLHIAASSGNATVCKLLVSKGAEIEATSSTGDTPLLLAARAGRVECVETLLFAGADPRTPNAMTARTALQEAIDRGHAEVSGKIQFCVVC